MHSPYWIDCQVAPPCMVWTLRTMSLTSDPGSYQINCCPYVPITWLLTNRRRVTSVALSPLNWTDVFVLCACLLRWELVNGLLNMVPEPGRHWELWEVGEDGKTLAALPVVGFCPVFGCAHVCSGGWACHWCCRFRRHVLPWGSLGWKRVAVLGCGEDHHRSVNAYWSARGFPIIGTFVWGRSLCRDSDTLRKPKKSSSTGRVALKYFNRINFFQFIIYVVVPGIILCTIDSDIKSLGANNLVWIGHLHFKLGCMKFCVCSEWTLLMVWWDMFTGGGSRIWGVSI